MYEYFAGRLVDKRPDHVILDVGGIGYKLHVSLHTFEGLGEATDVKLWAYLHVKEDLMALYGFGTQEERAIFQELIRVSGIGTSTARLILSSLRASEVKAAILSQNTSVFKAVKGIGSKTAQRLILDLKDKVGDIDTGETLPADPKSNDLYQEAESALRALGFPPNKIKKTLSQLSQSNELNNVEDIIKAGLKKLS
ncbi:MAG: Holliday junction branch migration protein RuvA [Bacteroidetes bacterium]|mgnify:CR=1 FL=1|jgi:Holliday junction DNA helicase RuvA|nr:Holliday junction branch migration protein RuvA [Bacteroidota bacterium]